MNRCQYCVIVLSGQERTALELGACRGSLAVTTEHLGENDEVVHDLESKVLCNRPKPILGESDS